MDHEIRKIGNGSTQSDSIILKKFRELDSLVLVFGIDQIVNSSDLEEVHELLYNLKEVQMLNLHSIEPEKIVTLMEKWIEMDKEKSATFAFRLLTAISNYESHRKYIRKKFGDDVLIPFGDGKSIYPSYDSSHFHFAVW